MAKKKPEPKPTDIVQVRLTAKHESQFVPYQRLRLMGPQWKVVDTDPDEVPESVAAEHPES